MIGDTAMGMARITLAESNKGTEVELQKLKVRLETRVYNGGKVYTCTYCCLVSNRSLINHINSHRKEILNQELTNLPLLLTTNEFTIREKIKRLEK